jgi:hypothetical protein
MQPLGQTPCRALGQARSGYTGVLPDTNASPTAGTSSHTGIAPAAEAALHVERTAPDDVQNRQIYVKLDGEPLATLLYGRSVHRAISAGTHQLKADNTWKSRTIEFTVTAGDRIAFQVVSRKGRGYDLLVGFFGAAPMEVALEEIPFPETPPQA